MLDPQDNMQTIGFSKHDVEPIAKQFKLYLATLVFTIQIKLSKERLDSLLYLMIDTYKKADFEGFRQIVHFLSHVC